MGLRKREEIELGEIGGKIRRCFNLCKMVEDGIQEPKMFKEIKKGLSYKIT